MMRMLAQLPMDPLSGLRDIHLPPLPPLWPPAPGWWLLTLLALAGVVLGVRHAWHLWRDGAARRAAVRYLAELRTRFQNGEAADALTAELSTLMRRTAMIRNSRSRVAGLTGDAWLDFLDDDEHSFSQGVGRCLITAPYARSESVDLGALLDLCEKWVRRNA